MRNSVFVLPGRKKNREEARFQQKNVPLKTEEILARDGEREIEKEKRNGGNSGCDPKHEQERKNNSAAAEEVKKSIAGTEPAQGGQKPKCPVANVSTRERQMIADRQNSARADQAVDLGPERNESDEIHQANCR